MTRATRSLAALGILTLVLAACSSVPSDGAAGEAAIPVPGGTTYPLTVQNCEAEVVFEQAPERVILLESAPVTILDGLGVLDRVVSRAGSFPAEYYTPDLVKRIDEIPALSENINASGHLLINTEVVIAEEPDLALGLPEGITREGLLDAGANALIQPVYCATGVGDTSFESLYEQVLVYGKIFDRSDEAEALVADLQRRVTAVEEVTAGAEKRTIAVLYPSIGGGPLYAYGRASMAQPQVEAAGFENVFADTADRVFEVSIEELLGHDPDAIVILYQGDGDAAIKEVTNLPGSESLRALENDDVLAQLFNFTEPPTPLSVDGLERIVGFFGDGS